MKLSSTVSVLTGSVISLLFARSVTAFGVIRSTANSFRHTQVPVTGVRQLYSSDSDEVKEGNDFGSEFSKGMYGRLGIKEDEIALGIDANEVTEVLHDFIL